MLKQPDNQFYIPCFSNRVGNTTRHLNNLKAGKFYPPQLTVILKLCAANPVTHQVDITLIIILKQEDEIANILLKKQIKYRLFV